MKRVSIVQIAQTHQVPVDQVEEVAGVLGVSVTSRSVEPSDGEIISHVFTEAKQNNMTPQEVARKFVATSSPEQGAGIGEVFDANAIARQRNDMNNRIQDATGDLVVSRVARNLAEARLNLTDWQVEDPNLRKMLNDSEALRRRSAAFSSQALPFSDMMGIAFVNLPIMEKYLPAATAQKALPGE